MRRVSWALALASLIVLPTLTEASDWKWKRVDREDGIIRLASSTFADGMAEGVDHGRSRDMGNEFKSEFAWWGFSEWHRYQIEVAFYWAKDRGGWNGWVRPSAFFDEFGTLNETWIKSAATEGPVIDTVIGEIKSFAFDIEKETFGDKVRECIGFTHGWDKRHLGGWTHYPKFLNFYACGTGGRRVSEETLLTILSGLSIEDEFDALVEE